MLATRIHRICRRVHAEESQSIVTLALMSLFILAILAVVVESSAVYIQRRNLQNAADAAALAGAQELNGLASGDDPAREKAKEYAAENVDGLIPGDEPIVSGHTQIQVQVRKKAATAFAGWLSFGEPVVSAKATARIASPLLPGPGVVPLGIDKETYDQCKVDGDCTDVTLKENSTNNDDPPSSYGLLDLGGGGGGANEVCEFLVGGSAFPIQDPDNLKSGNVSSLHNCLIDRMTAAAAADGTHPNRCITWEEVTDNDVLIDECNPLSGASRGKDTAFPLAQPTAVILIPILTDFDQAGCDTNPKCFDIVGEGDELRTFAFFLIDESTVWGPDPTCNESGQCWITGRFILEWPAPITTDFSQPTGEYNPDALLKVIQLID